MKTAEDLAKQYDGKTYRIWLLHKPYICIQTIEDISVGMNSQIDETKYDIGTKIIKAIINHEKIYCRYSSYMTPLSGTTGLGFFFFSFVINLLLKQKNKRSAPERQNKEILKVHKR